MSKRKSGTTLSRRGLFKGATIAGAVAAGSPLEANAQAAAPGPSGHAGPQSRAWKAGIRARRPSSRAVAAPTTWST